MLPLLDELRRFPSSIDSPFLTHTLSRITRDERVLRYATRATSVPAAEFFPAVAAGIREWPAASGGDEPPAAWTRLAEDTAALYQSIWKSQKVRLPGVRIQPIMSG